MKKRVLSLLIALCLVVGLFPAVAAETVASGSLGGISWTFADGVLTISGEGDMIREIDGEYLYNQYYPYCYDTTKIVVEEGITSLCRDAFSDFIYATEASLPSTLTKIENAAFINCFRLNEVTIPAGVAEMGDSVFDYTVGIDIRFTGDAPSMQVPRGDIEDGTWGTLSGVSGTIYYPANNPTWTEELMNTDYGQSEVVWTPYIPTSGTWGDNLTWDFSDATGTLTISGQGEMAASYEDDGTGNDDATDYHIYPWDTFRDSISTLVLEEGVTTVATGAFEDYQNLTEVSLSSSLTYIAWGAFYESGLVRVEIPDSVTSLGVSAFSCCEQLEYVKLPAGLQHSGEGPFGGCTKLTQIVMPQMPDLEFFGPWFFEECDALTDLDFFTAPMIGQEMFVGCSGLVDIRLPETVTTVLSWAFYQCENLTKVTIPGTVQFLGSTIFSECDKLTEIWFEGNAPENSGSLSGITATAYYPANNDTWTEEVRASFKGNITWVPYIPNPFTDVPAGSFYEDPVLWAVSNGITNGLTASTFGPDATCNRAQVVTFLWRAAGCPEPTSSVNPFVDVESGSFYEKPVLWAVEKSITNGSDATHFNPNGVCNRAQVVTFLYRAFESPAVSTSGLPFTDVPAGSWYEAPIAWAVENGITNGLSATEFGPNTSCNRAQVVTFLYRAYTD